MRGKEEKKKEEGKRGKKRRKGVKIGGQIAKNKQ